MHEPSTTAQATATPTRVRAWWTGPGHLLALLDSDTATLDNRDQETSRVAGLPEAHLIATYGAQAVVGADASGPEPAHIDLDGYLLDLAPETRCTRVGHLLGWGPAAWPAAAREELLECLRAALAGRPRRRSAAVCSEILLEARDVLRERHPLAVVAPDQAPGAQVELAVAVSGRQIYLRGWLGETADNLDAVVAVSPEGERVDITAGLERFPLRHVAEFYGLDDHDTPLGFAALATVSSPSPRCGGWLVEVHTRDGRSFETPCPDPVTDHSEARELLIGDMTIGGRRPGLLWAGQIAPALDTLQNELRNRVRIADDTWYGTPPADPDTSIIIPLYRRIDFVEHQMAQFVHDPKLAASEIIYVLDSPELARDLAAAAGRLYRLYRVPFRVLVVNENAGYSTANNLGAAAAAGRLLVLMNSDVLPVRPGWLDELTEVHDSTENVGCVGVKLLYEDESIQHAGMIFEPSPDGTTWVNEHRFKGLHRSFPAACVDGDVPAVTGACLMIAADTFRAVGGFDGGYVQGDFEDSDLCLRLQAAGLRCWYAAGVELYHLEGQSYPSPLRLLFQQHNMRRHTALWSPAIEKLSAPRCTLAATPATAPAAAPTSAEKSAKKTVKKSKTTKTVKTTTTTTTADNTKKETR